MPLQEIQRPKQLVVEGRSAAAFFSALLKHLCITDVQVQDLGGISEIKGSLKALANAPGFRTIVISLAVIRDAEENPAGAFQSVQHALEAARLPVPGAAETFVASQPKTGIFLLPDAATPGMLETLCLRSVQADPAVKCVNEFFACLQNQSLPQPRNLEKARLQAFLASRNKSGLLLGEAARANYWPWNHPSFKELIHFLREL